MNATLRAARRAAVVLLMLTLTGAGGCGFFKKEKDKVADAVRDGIKEKTGKTPSKVDLKFENNQYVGTADVDGEVWDVTATVKNNEIRWEAMERMTVPKVEKAAAQVLRENLKSEPENVSLKEASPGQYSGTFTLNGITFDLTAKVVGTDVLCEWKPRGVAK